jgi:selenocysteine lyase/cysteine desulfurase
VAGLSAAIDQIPEWGFVRAADLVGRCREILLESRAEVRTAPEQATLISFRLACDPAAFVLRAEQRGVIIRGLPDGWLRASVGWWNNQDDLERLGTLVRELSLQPSA